MTSPSRLETLKWISGQLDALKSQVVSDVQSNRDDMSGVPGGGFVAYSLKSTNGEPLRDTTIEALGITIDTFAKPRASWIWRPGASNWSGVSGLTGNSIRSTRPQAAFLG